MWAVWAVRAQDDLSDVSHIDDHIADSDCMVVFLSGSLDGAGQCSERWSQHVTRLLYADCGRIRDL